MSRDTGTLAALTYSTIITADVQMAMQENSFRLLTLNQPVLSRIDKFKSLDEFIRESLDEFLEESNITNSLRNPLINSFRSGFWGSF